MALPTGKFGDILPPGTPAPGGRNTAFPSSCGSGLRGYLTRAVGGTGRPLGKTFFLHCQRRHRELLKIPTYSLHVTRGIFLPTLCLSSMH